MGGEPLNGHRGTAGSCQKSSERDEAESREIANVRIRRHTSSARPCWPSTMRLPTRRDRGPWAEVLALVLRLPELWAKEQRLQLEAGRLGGSSGGGQGIDRDQLGSSLIGSESSSSGR
jgi:hypothetical protein